MYLKPLFPRSTGIHIEHPLQIRVASYLENVRVSADKQIRRIRFDSLLHRQTIPPGNPPNVSHPDPNTLPFKVLIVRIYTPNVLAIDIPINSHQGCNLFQLVRNGNGSKIACMPDLIALLKMFCDRLVKKMMRIGEQTNSHQQLLFPYDLFDV